MADLFVSTNMLIGGAVYKTGVGDLAVRDWQQGTLQQVELEGGRIIITNRFALDQGGHWTMASGTVFQAEGGLSLSGVITGLSQASLAVSSNLYLAGALTNLSVELTATSGNELQLDGATYENSSFSALSSTNDLLTLRQAGVYSAQDLGLEVSLIGFEQVRLNGDQAIIWELEEGELGSLDYQVYANTNSAIEDMLALSVAGSYSNGLFFSATNHIGFASYGLSMTNDVWIADPGDTNLLSLDARDGEDVIDFEYITVSADNIGTNKLYKNFEGALLTSASNTWQASDAYGQLTYLDGRGTYTLEYTQSVDTNAGEMGATGFYRNFNSVQLSEQGDAWSYTWVDQALEYVDAGGGVDTLRGDLQDASQLHSAGRYRHFEQVTLTTNANIWNSTPGDTLLLSIDALSGTDTLIGDFTNASTLGITNGLYRSFERVDLGGGEDLWEASIRDAEIGLEMVLGGAGSDRLSYASYEDVIPLYSREVVEPLYSGFETVVLTSGADVWLYDPQDPEVEASGGSDLLLIDDDVDSDALGLDRYEQFETLYMSEGILTLGDDPLVWSGTYKQGAAAVLAFSAQTNLATQARLSASQIELEAGTRLRVLGEEPSDWSFGNRYTNLIVEASTAPIIGPLDGLIEAAAGFEVKDWYISDNGIYMIFDRRSLADPLRGISGALTAVDEKILREIDTLTTAAAAGMIDAVFARSGGSNRYTAEDVQRVYQRSMAVPRAMSHQRNGALQTMAERSSERRMMLFEQNGPTGVSAPSVRSQRGNALWFKGYSANGSASEDGLSEGYDLTGVGSIVGLDAAVGEWVLGAAGGMFNQTMVMDDSGEYSGTGTHVGAYMSYGVEGWFFEANATLANTTLLLESDQGFELESEYSASDASFYIGSGYIMRDEKQVWTPSLGLLVYSYSQEEATDKKGLSVPVVIESFTQAGMQMRLGLTGAFRRMLIGRELLTQVTLHWMNHLTVLEDSADYQLAGGSEQYQMSLLNAPKSLVEIGLGAQLRMNRSFSLLMGFDYETGGGYSANRLSAGVRYNF